MIYGLLTKHEVKVAGYRPGSFLHVYTPREKRMMLLISSHLDQISSVNKGFIIWKKNAIFLQHTTHNPERASYPLG